MLNAENTKNKNVVIVRWSIVLLVLLAILSSWAFLTYQNALPDGFDM